jgi:hypothetical protein
MRSHFAHRHPHDIIIIQEEGLLGRCDCCDMFVPCSTMMSTTGVERKRKRLLDVKNL